MLWLSSGHVRHNICISEPRQTPWTFLSSSSVIWCFIPIIMEVLSTFLSGPLIQFSSLGLHRLNHCIYAAWSGDLMSTCSLESLCLCPLISCPPSSCVYCNLVFDTHNYILIFTTQTMSDHQALPSAFGAKCQRGSSSIERPTKQQGIVSKKFKQDVYHLKWDDIPEDAEQFKVCGSFIFSL